MKKQLAEDIDDSQSEEERLHAAISWKSMMEMVDRRETACKQVKPCPKCNSIQVELTDWSTPTLKMKCRVCKYKFEKTL